MLRACREVKISHRLPTDMATDGKRSPDCLQTTSVLSQIELGSGNVAVTSHFPEAGSVGIDQHASVRYWTDLLPGRTSSKRTYCQNDVKQQWQLHWRVTTLWWLLCLMLKVARYPFKYCHYVKPAFIVLEVKACVWLDRYLRQAKRNANKLGGSAELQSEIILLAGQDGFTQASADMHFHSNRQKQRR